MRIEQKYIIKHLSFKGKIKVTGKYSVCLAKNFLEKVKENIKSLKEKMANYVGEEAIQEKVNEKVEKVADKIDQLNKLKNQMKKQDEYKKGNDKYVLKEVKIELKKLRDKKKKVARKGLGVFALTKLTLSTVKENLNTKWNNYIEEREENKRQIEIERAKERLELNIEKLRKLKEEEKDILKLYPELKENYLLQSKKVTEIKNPSKETKEEIKKSNNFRKALAAMAIITGITIGGYALSNTLETQVDLNNNDLSNENTIQSESVLEEHNVSNLNITLEDRIDDKNDEIKTDVKLGDYLTIENGSTIYENPELIGNCGIIGNNGYDSETLFKVNAITYINENNEEVNFNLVQKSEQSQKLTLEKHRKFIENNENIIVKNFHVTPCDELGIPVDTTELGGWTNTNKSKIQNVDTGQITMEAYQSLERRVL